MQIFWGTIQGDEERIKRVLALSDARSTRTAQHVRSTFIKYGLLGQNKPLKKDFSHGCRKKDFGNRNSTYVT